MYFMRNSFQNFKLFLYADNGVQQQYESMNIVNIISTCIQLQF